MHDMTGVVPNTRENDPFYAGEKDWTPLRTFYHMLGLAGGKIKDGDDPFSSIVFHSTYLLELLAGDGGEEVFELVANGLMLAGAAALERHGLPIPVKYDALREQAISFNDEHAPATLERMKKVIDYGPERRQIREQHARK